MSPIAIQFVQGHSTADQSPSKQVEVTCPTGAQALGASWTVSDSTAALLNGLNSYFLPSFDGRSWLAMGDVRAAGPTWRLNLTVACGSVAGYSVVTSTSATDTSARKSINVECPSGAQALGAGWAVLDPTGAIVDGEALLFQMNAAGTSWQVAASNRSTFAPSWKLRETVLCATAGAVPGYQIVTQLGGTVTTQSQGSATCPPPKRALAGGWSLLDGAGAAVDGMALYSTYDGSSWLVSASPVQPATSSLEVRVICVN
jgi:hypothetical protein